MFNVTWPIYLALKMYPYIYMHKPIPLTHNYDSINTLQGLCRFLIFFLAKKSDATGHDIEILLIQLDKYMHVYTET